MLKLNRLIFAYALLLGVAPLVPKTANAEPIREKIGLEYLIAGTNDFYCRMEVCCYGIFDCQWGPNVCCGVS